MKRILVTLLLILLIFTGTSCQKQPDTEDTTDGITDSAINGTKDETVPAEETAQVVQTTEPTMAQGSSGDASAAKPAATTASGKPASTSSVQKAPAQAQASVTQPSTAATTEAATAASGIITQELICYNGSQKIYGKMVRPASSSRLPCVILSHSSSMTHESMKSYSEFFAGQGYAAYAFDFCGGSKKSKSDGDPDDMTIFTEVSDLEAVLKTMQGLSYIDKNQIYLFGTSQGGLVSALAANDHPSEIKGLILLYPGFSIPEQVNSFASGGKLSSAISSLYGQSGQAYLDTLIGYDAYEHIANFTGPVLIIHGTADFIVPIKYSEKAVATYQNAQLKVIQGASHGFNAENYSYKDYDAEVQQYILAYLNQ